MKKICQNLKIALALCLVLIVLTAGCGKEEKNITESVVETSAESSTESVTEISTETSADSGSETGEPVTGSGEEDLMKLAFQAAKEDAIEHLDPAKYEVSYQELPAQYYIQQPEKGWAIYDGKSYMAVYTDFQWSVTDFDDVTEDSLQYCLSDYEDGKYHKFTVSLVDFTCGTTTVLRECGDGDEELIKINGSVTAGSVNKETDGLQVPTDLSEYQGLPQTGSYEEDGYSCCEYGEQEGEPEILLILASGQAVALVEKGQMFTERIYYEVSLWDQSGKILYDNRIYVDDPDTWEGFETEYTYNEYGLLGEMTDPTGSSRYRYIYTDTLYPDAATLEAAIEISEDDIQSYEKMCQDHQENISH